MTGQLVFAANPLSPMFDSFAAEAYSVDAMSWFDMEASGRKPLLLWLCSIRDNSC